MVFVRWLTKDGDAHYFVGVSYAAVQQDIQSNFAHLTWESEGEIIQESDVEAVLPSMKVLGSSGDEAVSMKRELLANGKTSVRNGDSTSFLIGVVSEDAA